jgi:hypothetical protein
VDTGGLGETEETKSDRKSKESHPFRDRLDGAPALINRAGPRTAIDVEADPTVG